MPITNGVYEELSFDDALAAVIADADGNIVFSPGNPPELIIANMFAKADVEVDQQIGQTLAALMAPAGAMIDIMNPGMPRNAAVATVGTLKFVNSTGSSIPVPENTIFTAPNGQTYSIGFTTLSVAAGGTEYAAVTAVTAGAAGNVPAGTTFTGVTGLTITNLAIWTNGADEETDAQYLNRLTIAKTGYGAISASTSVETELRKIFTAARMYVNKGVDASATPVPLPGNGYNCVVLTPNGIYENSAIMSQIFDIISTRLELVNSQTLSSTNAGGHVTHKVFSGTVYISDVPLSYYYTAAQNIDATISASINVRFASGTSESEKATQAIDFATYFIQRLMSFLSGISGNATVTYVDGSAVSTVSTVAISADPGTVDAVAPSFGVAAIRDLVSDATTRKSTPQLMYDSTTALSIAMNPGVTGESTVTMTLVSARQFIDFKADALFTDGTSWFDRTMILDPSKISVTVTDIS